MSKNNNVNPGQYKVSGRERMTTSVKLGKGGSASGTVRFDGPPPAASDRAAIRVLAYAVAEDAPGAPN